MLKQLLLLTDGYSNRGTSPVTAAAKLREQGITVNVIGITDDDVDPLHRAAMIEIEQIAAAGKGLSSIVSKQDLLHTVQWLTRQSIAWQMQRTVVGRLLKERGGTASLTALHPDVRGAVVEWMEELESVCAVRVGVLVDTSASMRSKLPSVKRTLANVYMHLRSHQSQNELALCTFPARDDSFSISRLISWTSDLEQLRHWLHHICVGGVTPTGPALLAMGDVFKSVGGHTNDVI